MSTYAQGSSLIGDAPGIGERTGREERWPLPVATLFIVSTSLALWAGIYFVTVLVVG